MGSTGSRYSYLVCRKMPHWNAGAVECGLLPWLAVDVTSKNIVAVSVNEATGKNTRKPVKQEKKSNAVRQLTVPTPFRMEWMAKTKECYSTAMLGQPKTQLIFDVGAVGAGLQVS